MTWDGMGGMILHRIAWDGMVLHGLASDGTGAIGLHGMALDGMVLHRMASDATDGMDSTRAIGWHRMAWY